MAEKTETTETTYPIRLTKRLTGETHWDVAKGIYVPVTHGETGEPNAEYVLLATIDGVDVPIASYNAGRLETVAKSLKQAQSSSEG